MRVFFILSPLALGAGLACSNPLPPQSLHGTWISDSATLTITDTNATVLLLSASGCYGSFVRVANRIVSGRFSVAGTYTQLIGTFPGKIEYDAQSSGQFGSAQPDRHDQCCRRAARGRSTPHHEQCVTGLVSMQVSVTVDRGSGNYLKR